VRTTLHENCTSEYTLSAMLAGTYSVAVVPVLHGATEADPKAPLPIEVRLTGRVMFVRLVQDSNTPVPMPERELGRTILAKLEQLMKE
jgi:D-aminopeptidase